MADGPNLSAYDRECLEQLDKAGLRGFQHVIHDAEDMKRLAETERREPGGNWARKTKLFSHVQQGQLNGYLDTSAGFTYADKACVWARHLCERQGVKFVLGSERGRLKDLVTTGSGPAREVVGITTEDGEQHRADVVVVACEQPQDVVPEREIHRLTSLFDRRRMDAWYPTRGGRYSRGYGRLGHHDAASRRAAGSLGPLRPGELPGVGIRPDWAFLARVRRFLRVSQNLGRKSEDRL